MSSDREKETKALNVVIERPGEAEIVDAGVLSSGPGLVEEVEYDPLTGTVRRTGARHTRPRPGTAD